MFVEQAQIDSMIDKIMVSVEKMEKKRLELLEKHSFKSYKRVVAILGGTLLFFFIAFFLFPGVIPTWFTGLFPLIGLFAIVYPIVIWYKRSQGSKILWAELKTLIFELFGKETSMNLSKEVQYMGGDFKKTLLFRDDNFLKFHNLRELNGKLGDLDFKILDLELRGARSNDTRIKSSTGAMVFTGLCGVVKLKETKDTGLLIHSKYWREYTEADLANTDYNDFFLVETVGENDNTDMLDESLKGLLLELRKKIFSLNISIYRNSLSVALSPLGAFKCEYYHPMSDRNTIREYVYSLFMVRGLIQQLLLKFN